MLSYEFEQTFYSLMRYWPGDKMAQDWWQCWCGMPMGYDQLT